MTTNEQAGPISEIVRQARETQDTTLEGLADALGVTKQAVFSWENGISVPAPERVADWIGDRRKWVRGMGLRIFAAQSGDIIAELIRESATHAQQDDDPGDVAGS